MNYKKAMVVMDTLQQLEVLIEHDRRIEKWREDIVQIRAGRLPDGIDGAPTLENWDFVPIQKFCLKGTVYRHPKLPDGGEIETSEVLLYSKSPPIVRTENRWYFLKGVQAGILREPK